MYFFYLEISQIRGMFYGLNSDWNVGLLAVYCAIFSAQVLVQMNMMQKWYFKLIGLLNWFKPFKVFCNHDLS